MAQGPDDPQRFDPYRNFRFRIEWDGRHVAGFSKCSALEHFNGEVLRKDGGHPDASTESPAPATPILLERGVTGDSGFERWANQAWKYSSSPERYAAPDDLARDLRLEVYDEAGRLALAYRIVRCRVSEFQALPDPDANANEVAIQTIKLDNEGWERVAEGRD